MPKLRPINLLTGHSTSPKQEIFCQEYVRTGEPKLAAAKAYPTQTQPDVQAIKNFSNPTVVQRIHEIRAEAIGLLAANPITALPNLINETAKHITATKKVIYNSTGEYYTEPDRESQSKGQDRAYKLYGLMDRYQLDAQPTLSMTFNANPVALQQIADTLEQLNRRLGFETVDAESIKE